MKRVFLATKSVMENGNFKLKHKLSGMKVSPVSKQLGEYTIESTIGGKPICALPPCDLFLPFMKTIFKIEVKTHDSLDTTMEEIALSENLGDTLQRYGKDSIKNVETIFYDGLIFVDFRNLLQYINDNITIASIKDDKLIIDLKGKSYVIEWNNTMSELTFRDIAIKVVDIVTEDYFKIKEEKGDK